MFAKRTHWGRRRLAGFWLRIIVIQARVGGRNTLRNEPIRGAGGWTVSGCESLLYGLGLVHGILCETNPFRGAGGRPVSGCESLLYGFGLVPGILWKTTLFGALAASLFLVANHCYTGSGWCTEYFAKRTHFGALAAGRFLVANHCCTVLVWCRESFGKRPFSGPWRPACFWLRIIVIRARVGARNTLRNEPIRGSAAFFFSGSSRPVSTKPVLI